MKKFTIALAAMLAAFTPCLASDQDQPNVVLVMTDDVGYGDLACHGNPFIKTPNLDKLFAHSVRLTDFHVSPKCSPTRASLLTGRHCRHVGVRNTNFTENLLSTEVPTLADLFAANGYRTGIFGKWHLGEHFPFRPQDRGFQEVVVHGDGAVSTVGDIWGNDYFDDTYWHNGKKEAYQGFCTKVWFDQAMNFMRKSGDKPFFVYLPTNAAHGPMFAPEKDKAIYSDKSRNVAGFFGMITNFDTHMGRLMAFLEREGLRENTILIYTSDNGSAAGWRFFNAGMQGGKMSPYDGGHRLPCFLHWPGGGLKGGRDVDQLAAHLDLWPTLVELCGLEWEDTPLDGISLVPQLAGAEPSQPRTLVESFLGIVMTERWRLVNGKELYDIKADPGQEQDLAAQHPEVVNRLQGVLEDQQRKNDDIQRRYIIGAKQNPVTFSPDDWIKPTLGYGQIQIRNGVMGFAPCPYPHPRCAIVLVLADVVVDMLEALSGDCVGSYDLRGSRLAERCVEWIAAVQEAGLSGVARGMLNKRCCHVEHGGCAMLSVTEWTQLNFSACELGDKRRTKRLVRVAEQVCNHPSASLPNQIEQWGDLKAAYRLFDNDQVTFEAIARPHWELTKQAAEGRCLVIGDTTEFDFGKNREISGLGPTGNGSGQGFLLHNALLVDAESEEIIGVAGQTIHYRKKKKSKKRENSAQILKRKRESQVWGTVIDQIGKPQNEAEYVHVFDRGGDNFEVYCRLLQNDGQWVIRASKMNRHVLVGESEERMPLKDYLPQLQTLGQYTLSLRARPGQAARDAQIEVRVGRIKIPRPRQVSPWVRSLKQSPIAMNVIEVVEVTTPSNK